MIRSLSIKNFRVFKDVSVDQCRRINILVGENGSGKTALLEALFLAAGASPELAMRTRAWRGVESDRLTGTLDDIHRALFADLFHNFQTRNSAIISLKGIGQENRSVTVKFNPRGQRRVKPPSRRQPGVSPKLVPEKSGIEFTWKIEGRIAFTASAEFKDNRLTFPSAPESIVKGVFFASNQLPPSLEIANRFSLLSRTYRDKKFIQQFNDLYSNITDLSVEVDTGAPMLFAKVGDLCEKLPLSLASGGMSKLAAILLSMPHQAGGVILIDEIENGFYYKRLPMVWEAIVEFALEYDCQIFASTHSRECLEALAKAFADSEDDVSLIRVERQNTGEAIIREFVGSSFRAGIETGAEVR